MNNSVSAGLQAAALTNSRDFEDRDRRRQALRVGVWRALNRPHHVHALQHAAERGEPLAIGIARAAEVERRLIVDADEPARRGAVGLPAGHRDHAVGVAQAGDARALERDSGKTVLGPTGAAAGTYHS